MKLLHNRRLGRSPSVLVLPAVLALVACGSDDTRQGTSDPVEDTVHIGTPHTNDVSTVKDLLEERRSCCDDVLDTEMQDAVDAPGDHRPGLDITPIPDSQHHDNGDPCEGTCPTGCGDGFCVFPESAQSCPEDCRETCGDGFCTHDETVLTCPDDCHGCGDGTCTLPESACSCPQDCPSKCGDGCCSTGENHANCAVDCSVTCGDGVCSLGENPGSCPGDCPTQCGDGYCAGSETTCSCPQDCGWHCGNGACDCGETADSCAKDCVVCGDGLCNGTENHCTCALDCPVSCGDHCCSPTESACSCSQDCSKVCGDGCCTHTETPVSCLPDCPTTCGDGFCAGTETACSCPQDCTSVCGDGCCSHVENPVTCLQDCPTTCGDGYCAGAETACSCPQDCGEHCGNGSCDCGETKDFCPQDCDFPAVPSNACITGTQSRDGCPNARIVGRADARNTWNLTNQNTCNASDRFTGKCGSYWAEGPDHTYAIYVLAGESVQITLKARYGDCSYWDAGLAPRLRRYFNAQTTPGGATACPTFVGCAASAWVAGTVTVTHSASQSGWLFLIVDGGEDLWEESEHQGYYDLKVILSNCSHPQCSC